MEYIKNLDIKFQLTNEYLRNGGVEKISHKGLLQEIIDVKYDEFSNPIPNSFGPRLRSFMTLMLLSQTMELPISDHFQSEYDSLLQKSYSFDQKQIDSETEFDELVEKYQNAENILFRGQREASWRLYNSLQRLWITKQLFKSEDGYVNFVKKLIKNGKEKHQDNIKAILKKFSIDSLNDISVLGYLQHHGCPTPLLDWTYNFETSLYFALDGLQANTKVKEINDYVSVYYLEEEHIVSYKDLLKETIENVGGKLKIKLINHLAKDKETEDEIKEKFKDRNFFDKNRFDGSGLVKGMTEIDNLSGFQISFFSDKDVESGLIFSLKNNANIQNQNGVFMLNPNPISPLEVVGKEVYKESDKDKEVKNYRFCRCFNIHKSLEDHVRKYLKSKGIIKEYIYASKDIDTWPIYERSLNKKLKVN